MVNPEIQLFETNTTHGQNAIEVLKKRLKGGLDIRIDKVEDLTPDVPPSISKTFSQKTKEKNRLQLLLLLLGFFLVALATFARFLNT